MTGPFEKIIPVVAAMTAVHLATTNRISQNSRSQKATQSRRRLRRQSADQRKT
jgi:Flp pilus assembly protein TadB